MKIIKNKSIVEDDWSVLRLNAQQLPENTQVPEGKVIVPLQVWLTQRQALLERAEIGVWFASDERPELLKGDIERFSVIAIDFPNFLMGEGIRLPTICVFVLDTQKNYVRLGMYYAINYSICSVLVLMLLNLDLIETLKMR